MLELSDKDNKDFFIGKNIFDLINIERFNLDEAEEKEYLESKVNFQWENELWVDYSVEKVLESAVNEYIIAFKDITSRKALEKRLTYLSYKDKMTGLYNYRYFMKELDKLDSSREIPISILVTDIDELKAINDEKGHIFGNKIIKKTAEILKDSVRENDTLARLGGDEFAVLLPNADSQTAEKVGKRIYSKLEEYNKKSPQDERISLSIGWGTKESNQTSLKEILEYADLKMYDVKNLSD
jgi:diguanylate cyclase (GGDEF)-like protein